MISDLPSGKRLHNELENHYFQWVNPLFLWPFSIANFVCLPEGICQFPIAMLYYPEAIF